MQLLQNAGIFSGTKAFVRCDLDVPVENGKILDKYRLETSLGTLKYIQEKGGYPIIAGHIGKPEGVFDENLSTKILLPYFNEKLGENTFELIENLRFDSREEKNESSYAKELAVRADIYVNESFATSHRNHISIVGVPALIPHFAGLRLQKEVDTLTSLIKSPKKPFIGIVGGAKLESKLPVITKLLTICDYVLLGGKLASYWDKPIPNNLILAEDSIDGKDIGPNTIRKFNLLISSANTLVWAGPLGMYEEETYIKGTCQIASQIVKKTKEEKMTSVVGGGDTIAALEKCGGIFDVSFVSTGGSAMLQFLVNETLPGIEALR